MLKKDLKTAMFFSFFKPFVYMCRFSLDFFLELKNHVDQGGIFELKECGNSNLKSYILNIAWFKENYILM